MFMNNSQQRILDASVEDMVRGYEENRVARHFVCLICGEKYEDGVIYHDGKRWCQAEKMMTVHIENEHQSSFHHLLQLNKKWTGLTEQQKQLLELFYEGKSDAQIVQELGGGSTSTIRNYRFTFREKQKQAKVFLALMSMLESQARRHSELEREQAAMKPRSPKPQANDSEETIRTYFPDGPDGSLIRIPRKHKVRQMVLLHIATRFQADRIYTEKEVNELLRAVHADEYVTIRRQLIEAGLIDRKKDGSQYWVVGAKTVDKSRRKELAAEFQEKKAQIGIFVVKNKQNGKMFIDRSVNMEGSFNLIRFGLETGTHPNQEMLQDWRKYGDDAFEYSVLELVKEDDTKGLNRRALLKILDELKAKWLEKLQPFGDSGYHEPS
jgi:DNA-binding CsgD family transcriptional regulator